MQSSSSIRRSFIDFFKSKGHQHLPSSPLVPANDPSLLFTNAGMVQFKDIFLGNEKASSARAVTSQRCVRVGGKHNDLENVGYTARHHTFFEMLGNFSFADYGKEEAIAYAWEYLTEVAKLPPEKLWVTVFTEDQEAEHIWLKDVGVDPKRFSRIGEKDNFWTMGQIGPCGPCTEIFYDHGAGVPGGAPGEPNSEADRYIEIWNLVFMQYERSADGTQSELPKLSVDTGMGLERLTAALQGVHSNYDIDLFQRLIKKAADLTGCKDLSSPSLKVIADHIRSSGFLIVDGVMPSNEGRGYALRRIIRRALRHGYKLNAPDTFFYRLLDELSDEMGDAFPELKKSKDKVAEILKTEEQKFSETLTVGMKLLEDAIQNLSSKQLPGDVIFKLYDTYGFPVDLTADVARERGLTLDTQAFEQLMGQQKETAKRSSGFSASAASSHKIDSEQHEFSGYQTTEDSGRIVALFHNDQAVDSLSAGQSGIVVLDKTPFYGESGGQVGDSGLLRGEDGLFEVEDTQKQGQFHKHIGNLKEGVLKLNDHIAGMVDVVRRKAIMRNHSATHLLHAALKEVLGEHIEQKGSLVADDRLRFDFSHNKPLEAAEVERIEALVNHEVLHNIAVQSEWLKKDQAMEQGAVALFGEKYGEEVRVLTMGNFSKELCGGTHVERTGDIGTFKIAGQSSVASGIRRIEGVTGDHAMLYVRELQDSIAKLCRLVNAPQDAVYARVEKLLNDHKQLQKELNSGNPTSQSIDAKALVAQAVDIDGITVLAVEVPHTNKKMLRNLLDQLKATMSSGIIVLASSDQGRVMLLAGVTDNLTERFRADRIVNQVASQVGGKGGGRADMAEAGGENPAGLPQALASVPAYIRSVAQA